jgi:hypothetical protein
MHSTVSRHFRIWMQIGPQKVAEETWFWNGVRGNTKMTTGKLLTLIYSLAKGVLSDATATETIIHFNHKSLTLISFDMIMSTCFLFIQWYKFIDLYDLVKRPLYAYTNFLSSVLHWLAPRLMAWFDYCDSAVHFLLIWTRLVLQDRSCISM